MTTLDLNNVSGKILTSHYKYIFNLYKILNPTKTPQVSHVSQVSQVSPVEKIDDTKVFIIKKNKMVIKFNIELNEDSINLKIIDGKHGEFSMSIYKKTIVIYGLFSYIKYFQLLDSFFLYINIPYIIINPCYELDIESFTLLNFKNKSFKLTFNENISALFGLYYLINNKTPLELFEYNFIHLDRNTQSLFCNKKNNDCVQELKNINFELLLKDLEKYSEYIDKKVKQSQNETDENFKFKSYNPYFYLYYNLQFLIVSYKFIDIINKYAKNKYKNLYIFLCEILLDDYIFLSNFSSTYPSHNEITNLFKIIGKLTYIVNNINSTSNNYYMKKYI